MTTNEIKANELETAPAVGKGVDEHPDDLAVDRFAAAMKAKLAKKRAEGRGGWDDPAQCPVELLSNLLHEHVAKGDPVDVGNLAMMLHQRDSGVLPPQGDLQSDLDLIWHSVSDTKETNAAHARLQAALTRQPVAGESHCVACGASSCRGINFCEPVAGDGMVLVRGGMLRHWLRELNRARICESPAGDICDHVHASVLAVLNNAGRAGPRGGASLDNPSRVTFGSGAAGAALLDPSEYIQYLQDPSPVEKTPFSAASLAERRALNKGLDALDALSEEWAKEVNLESICTKLAQARDVPAAIYAMVVLGWVEGAYAGRTSHQDFPVSPQPFRNMQDGATFEQYRDALAVGGLTPVDQMAFDNMLHDRFFAPPDVDAGAERVMAAVAKSIGAIKECHTIPSTYCHKPDGGDHG